MYESLVAYTLRWSSLFLVKVWEHRVEEKSWRKCPSTIIARLAGKHKIKRRRRRRIGIGIGIGIGVSLGQGWISTKYE
jgi:hypothetical protein